jgi:excinuclease UvrABC ATPase subunit
VNIVICNTCKGDGKIDIETYFQQSELKACPSCKGTGRRIQKQYTLTIPYTEEQSEFRKTDEEIFKLINNAKRM